MLLARRDRDQLDELAGALTDAGGYARFGLTPTYRLQVAKGLEGVEAWYGLYGSRERRRWLKVAAELDLVVTGGSDFHGTYTPSVAEPGIDFPEVHALRLCEWLELELELG